MDEFAGSDAKKPASTEQAGVLCVDLDGTFLKTDTLYESLFRALKAHPGIVFLLPMWAAQGRYRFKQAIADLVHDGIDPSTWPRRSEVERLIETAKSEGKTVELVSATDHRLIAGESAFGDTFHAVIGSSDGVNLSGDAKAEYLKARHPEGFAYVGNSAADLPVWRAATERYAVGLSSSLRRRAESEGLELKEIAPNEPRLRGLLRSMRLHQWLKNLLVLVPLGLLGPRAAMSDAFVFFIGFVLFGLLTSGTYLVNDILDVESDRRHARKSARPIASGELPLELAALAAFALIGGALIGAALLSPPFAVVLLAYLALTLAYSFVLKRIALVDVLAIAALFTLRIVAGMALVGQPPSEWLLIFSIFFFFSLALMKREVELGHMDVAGVDVMHGRGYALDDRPLLLAFGVSSGVASLVVFALFVSSMTEQAASTYVSPKWLWGALAVLSYWIMRMWLLTVRGQMNDDPILYAARDRVSLVLAALIAVFILAAQLMRI